MFDDGEDVNRGPPARASGEPASPGDIGELSAMEWLASKGATVWVPLNHSAHVDLMAEWDERMIRVQVKTSTLRSRPKAGGERWKVAIATRGGNRSWTGLTKKFDPVRVDYLFALVADGRRWFIPTAFVEASNELSLGGSKYSEFEIEPGTAFEATIYADGQPNTILTSDAPGECLSGQKDVTVNHAAMPSQVRILPPPSPPASAQILFRPKRQATIPRRPSKPGGRPAEHAVSRSCPSPPVAVSSAR